MNEMTTTERTKYDAHVVASWEEASIARAPKDAHCRARNVQICQIRDVAADAFEEHGSLALTLLVLTESGLTLEQGLEILARFERATLPQVGEILVSSWGYDQTNVDYYQVVKVTKASVQIVEIGKTVIAGEHSDTVTPSAGTFTGKPMTRRFRSEARRAGWSCSISDYSSARLWNGQADRQTAANCGH